MIETPNLALYQPEKTDMADIDDINDNMGVIDGLAGDIATFETSPATAAHSVGEYLLYDGHVYKVTAAIAAGDSLTLGTNVRAANLGTELSALFKAIQD